MRILTVYGNNGAMQRAIRGMHLANNAMRASVCQTYTLQSLRAPTEVMQGVVISDVQDIDKLKGVYYDAVIEDGSFNPERVFQTGHWAWVVFLKVHVLRSV